MTPIEEISYYDLGYCCTFCKTKENFGELSNMAAGFPLLVNNVSICTVEALYQAMRFSKFPYIQKLIIDQKSPMSAKQVAYKFIENGVEVDEGALGETGRIKTIHRAVREDWDKVRVDIMDWCLKLKLKQNPHFAQILLSTGNKPIVEYSPKDEFWGAKKTETYHSLGDFFKTQYRGANVLGKLLTRLRDNLGTLENVPVTPDIPDFLFYNSQII